MLNFDGLEDFIPNGTPLEKAVNLIPGVGGEFGEKRGRPAARPGEIHRWRDGNLYKKNAPKQRWDPLSQGLKPISFKEWGAHYHPVDPNTHEDVETFSREVFRNKKAKSLGESQELTLRKPSFAAKHKLKVQDVGVAPLRSFGKARRINSNEDRQSWCSENVYVPANIFTTMGNNNMKFNGFDVGNKLFHQPVIVLTKGCQRLVALMERVENGVMPRVTELEACYEGTCFLNSSAYASFGNFENVDVKNLAFTAPAAYLNAFKKNNRISFAKQKVPSTNYGKIERLMQLHKSRGFPGEMILDKKAGTGQLKLTFKEFAESGLFLREGQQGDSSHLFPTMNIPGVIDNSSFAVEWLKACRENDVKNKTVFISASYAPVSDEDYTKLLPYKDQFKIHFTLSGWFHRNETMIRLAEFQAALKLGLPAMVRVITNIDEIDGATFNEKNYEFIMDALKEMGISRKLIIETPYHNDNPGIKGHSRPRIPRKDAVRCCETSQCVDCPVTCGNYGEYDPVLSKFVKEEQKKDLKKAFNLFGGLEEYLPDLLKGVEEAPTYESINRILAGKKPSETFRRWMATGYLEEYFPELYALKGVQQDKQWHPEGSVWNHTMLAIDFYQGDVIGKWALLFHDLGKEITHVIVKGGKHTFPEHAKESAKIARKILTRLAVPKRMADRILWLIKIHNDYHKVTEYSIEQIKQLVKHPDFNIYMRVAFADEGSRGRTPVAWIEAVKRLQGLSKLDKLPGDVDLSLPKNGKELLSGK